MVRSCETCWCTKAALLGKALGPSAAVSHRGALMASSLAMRNRWCRIFVCILKPGLWKESVGPHKGSQHSMRTVRMPRRRQVACVSCRGSSGTRSLARQNGGSAIMHAPSPACGWTLQGHAG